MTRQGQHVYRVASGTWELSDFQLSKHGVSALEQLDPLQRVQVE